MKRKIRLMAQPVPEEIPVVTPEECDKEYRAYLVFVTDYLSRYADTSELKHLGLTRRSPEPV